MKYHLHPRCTCPMRTPEEVLLNVHFLSCDLMYKSNHYPRKRKRFFLFYPLKKVHK